MDEEEGFKSFILEMALEMAERSEAKITRSVASRQKSKL